MDEEEDAADEGSDSTFMAPVPDAAEYLAAQYGTPSWSQLSQAAEMLAAKFGLPECQMLAAAMVAGITKTKITGRELEYIRLKDRMILATPGTYDDLEEIYSAAVWLSDVLKMKQSETAFDKEKTERLVDALDDFAASFDARLAYEAPVNESGKKTRRALEARSFLREMTFEWFEQTGKWPVAYYDKAIGQARGEFWPFAQAACDAVGIRCPSIQSLEKWLKRYGRESGAETAQESGPRNS